LALRKVHRNLDLLRSLVFPLGRRFYTQISEEQILEATKRFMVAFARARGLLPRDPLASREEIRKATKEMEIIKQVLTPEDYQHVMALLSEIEAFLGKHEIESAIAKMEALWTWMLTKAFPPPPYIASPFPVEMKGSSYTQIKLIPERVGECYKDAYHFLLREGEGLLVHGEVTSPADTRVIKHAWVELDGYVWEPQTKQYFRKPDFYDVFKPKVQAKYTPLEAAKLAVKTRHYGPWEETRSRVQIPPGTDMLYRYAMPPRIEGKYSNSVSSTLELKSRFGAEIKEMITEAESQKREVGAMLCRTATGQPHLSRACYGRRETVTVADCHDGLSPQGSFHVHLGGTDVFSVPDLKTGIRREKLSCIGYIKSRSVKLKCLTPSKYYQYPMTQRAEIDRMLAEAESDIQEATRLFKLSPSNREAIMLSQRAQEKLLQVEKLLDSYETEL